MQAKFLIVFQPVAGLIVTCTDGFKQPVGQPSVGKKRERYACAFVFNYSYQFGLFSVSFLKCFHYTGGTAL